MAKPRESKPYIWATWLSRLLSGDDWCEWRAWFQAHHYSDSWIRAGTGFDSARWKMEHSRLLWESREGLEYDGYTVWVEKQNKFWLEGAGATIGGQPDLLAEKHGDITVIDVKTGTPRQSDIVQVMLYMYGLDRSVPAWGDITLKGRVVYSDHVVDIPADAISPEFIEQMGSLIRRVADSKSALVVPSSTECGFCSITLEECPKRTSVPRDAVTSRYRSSSTLMLQTGSFASKGIHD